MEEELGPYRQAMLAGLTGRVVEIGAGNGMNFAHYPSEVTQILAVEPEPRLRNLAKAAASQADALINVVDGVADRLPADDESFDAAVLSLVLCTVPKPAVALAETHRVLRPGGELRFLEHVRAESTSQRQLQRLLDTTIWPILGGGCHSHRDTERAIRDAGYTIEHLERIRFPDKWISTPTSPHILGGATRQAP